MQPTVVEDEWKEFEAEERKDYSGLKIGQLQINDDGDEPTDDTAFEKDDSENETALDADRQRTNGPWSKKGDAESAAQAAAAAAPEPAPAPAAVSTEKSFYVSPAMRMGQVCQVDVVVLRICCIYTNRLHDLLCVAVAFADGTLEIAQGRSARHSRSGILSGTGRCQAGGGEEEATRARFRRGATRRSVESSVGDGQQCTRLDRQPLQLISR